nr:hypothetical protein [Tanacetum cinerariifolium]
SKTKEGLCKELQSRLVDNSKLNVVYLLNKSLKCFVSLLEGLKAGKRLLYVKRYKAISLGKAGQMKPEGQWTRDERKSDNLDQGLKSLILYILSDDQTNSVINCLTTKSTWDALILYHEDFQDSPDDEEDTRSGHEYLNDLEEEYQERALSSKSKRFFKHGTQSNKPRLSKTKDFNLPNRDTGKVPSDESQRNTTNPSVAASDSLAIDYDSANKSSVNITPLPPLEKLAGAKPTTQHLTGQGESSLRSRPSRPVISFPSCIHYGYNDHQSDDYVYNLIPEHVIKIYETCGSNVHIATGYNDIKWFRKGKALKAKKAGANKIVSSNVQRSKTPTKRTEEEKARRRGKVYNWETATYGKIWYDEDVHDLRYVETKFPSIVFNDTLKFKPTVSPLNDNKIDFRLSFDESDDEYYTVIYEKNSFFYKIISVNDLKTDSENDNDKVDMPSFLTPEPTVSYFDDLDFFKDFENKFPANVYNDALTSKLDFLTEPTVSPQHIDEFNLKDETSLSECDEEEQNVL